MSPSRHCTIGMLRSMFNDYYDHTCTIDSVACIVMSADPSLLPSLPWCGVLCFVVFWCASLAVQDESDQEEAVMDLEGAGVRGDSDGSSDDDDEDDDGSDDDDSDASDLPEVRRPLTS